MLRWFHALMPKEERFFDLFARHSQAVLAGARALRAMLEGGDQIEYEDQDKRIHQMFLDEIRKTGAPSMSNGSPSRNTWVT